MIKVTLLPQLTANPLAYFSMCEKMRFIYLTSFIVVFLKKGKSNTSYSVISQNKAGALILTFATISPKTLIM